MNDNINPPRCPKCGTLEHVYWILPGMFRCRVCRESYEVDEHANVFLIPKREEEVEYGI